MDLGCSNQKIHGSSYAIFLSTPLIEWNPSPLVSEMTLPYRFVLTRFGNISYAKNSTYKIQKDKSNIKTTKILHVNFVTAYTTVTTF